MSKTGLLSFVLITVIETGKDAFIIIVLLNCGFPSLAYT